MKFYIARDEWFFKEFYGDINEALWVRDHNKAQDYPNFNEANVAACELQTILESHLHVVMA